MGADKRAGRVPSASSTSRTSRAIGVWRQPSLVWRTQRGKHARAKAQAHYKQQEGKRDTARKAGSVEFGFARSCQVADV